MVKNTYHHTGLKEDLIKQGLYLLNREGYEGFSIRKVAALCGVSHSAPYRHFSNKEALIGAITAQVTESFTSMIENVIQKNSINLKAAVMEIGKQYVKFMVDNTEYFKFIFLNNHHSPIIISGDEFIIREDHPFQLIRKCYAEYFASVHMDEQDLAAETLSLWSLVHGFAVLIIHNTISYPGDYLELLSRILDKRLGEVDA